MFEIFTRDMGKWTQLFIEILNEGKGRLGLTSVEGARGQNKDKVKQTERE